MDSRKLKGICLLVLSVANILLFTHLAINGFFLERADSTALDDLASFMEKNGVGINIAGVPREVVRSTAWELDISSPLASGAQELFAGALLGDGYSQVPGGETALFTADDGDYVQLYLACEVDASLTLSDGITETLQDATDRVRELIAATPVNPDDVVTVLSGDADHGYHGNSQLKFMSLPVFNGTLMYVFTLDGKITVKGRWPLIEATQYGSEVSHSAISLLAAFSAICARDGIAATRVESAAYGFYLIHYTKGVYILAPCMEIDTDIGLFYINALTTELIV